MRIEININEEVTSAIQKKADRINQSRKGYIELLCMQDAEKTDVVSVREIAHLIANKMRMPYCWEDIYNRLAMGIKLPDKLTDDKTLMVFKKLKSAGAKKKNK